MESTTKSTEENSQAGNDDLRVGGEKVVFDAGQKLDFSGANRKLVIAIVFVSSLLLGMMSSLIESLDESKIVYGRIFVSAIAVAIIMFMAFVYLRPTVYKGENIVSDVNLDAVKRYVDRRLSQVAGLDATGGAVITDDDKANLVRKIQERLESDSFREGLSNELCNLGFHSAPRGTRSSNITWKL